MNIQEAKEQIKRSVSIYLMKDSYGNYRISSEKQRPIFMVGAPGIGKTAIVSQIASKMGISLVSYAMTHHTRQSAIGLPFIEHKTYQQQEFDVSVYTLSEIIASVYENMEKSGNKEGILFLDEINCVSETLSPSLLQFLQYKSFGNHFLPEGWIIVTAGNPTEFNRNARNFDIATLDRLKVLQVEPSYEAWREYAFALHIHHAITSFLDVHSEDFFQVQSTVDGKSYVTPRGWEDLSQAMLLYEEAGYPIDESLIQQYLHDEEITSTFATYYSLYEKYQQAYNVPSILRGLIGEEEITKMKNANWDERLAVTNLCLNPITLDIQKEIQQEEGLKSLVNVFRAAKGSDDFYPVLQAGLVSLQKKYEQEKSTGYLQKKKKLVYEYEMYVLKEAMKKATFEEVKTFYQQQVSIMKELIQTIDAQLTNLFLFLEKAAGEQELLLAVTQLTVDTDCARYIAVNGCAKYYEHSELMMSKKRNAQLLKQFEEYKAKYQSETQV